MKIYINNLNLNILKDIEDILSNQYVISDNYIQLYTNEGIYSIEKDNIYALEPIDKDIKIYEKYFNNFTIIVDSSYFKKTLTSCINGNRHLSVNVKKDFYRFHKNSKMQLIIENHKNMLSGDYIPSDIYFEFDQNIDINELFIKQDITEFLSLLN
jgi:hypothetical protein